MRDKADKAHAELKERASAVKRWHLLQNEGVEVIEEQMRKAEEAKELVATFDEEERWPRGGPLGGPVAPSQPRLGLVGLERGLERGLKAENATEVACNRYTILPRMGQPLLRVLLQATPRTAQPFL